MRPPRWLPGPLVVCVGLIVGRAHAEEAASPLEKLTGTVDAGPSVKTLYDIWFIGAHARAGLGGVRSDRKTRLYGTLDVFRGNDDRVLQLTSSMVGFAIERHVDTRFFFGGTAEVGAVTVRGGTHHWLSTGAGLGAFLGVDIVHLRTSTDFFVAVSGTLHALRGHEAAAASSANAAVSFGVRL